MINASEMMMKTAMSRTIGRRTASLQNYLATARRWSLAVLCGVLMTGTLLAQDAPKQEGEPQNSRQETPLSNNLLEVMRPTAQTDSTLDEDIIFTSPGFPHYARSIRQSDNLGWMSIYSTDALTFSPNGAAIHLSGNGATGFPGQIYFDSGAHNSAALIFRTAGTGGTITERMRVTADGKIGIGLTNPQATLHVSSPSQSGDAVIGGAVLGTGVYGRSSGGKGVYGWSNSDFGVFGESISDAGVYGYSRVGTGVIGESTSGNAGSFFGRVQVFGPLTKSSGSFKIDHPLDPENKYLSHSFVESPDMMNIYNGNVTTDARGRAVIMLPSYFTALNRDYRYQLTVVGQFAQAIVASEIKGNRFTIKTNKPQVKVSWQVTGVRQDAYAEKHRIEVEEDKPAAERGTYLNPEAFGQPAEKGVAHARQPASPSRPKEENRTARLQR